MNLNISFLIMMKLRLLLIITVPVGRLYLEYIVWHLTNVISANIHESSFENKSNSNFFLL